MEKSIGASLKASPGLLWLTALGATTLVGADLATVAFGPFPGLDFIFRLTLAIFGCLFCAFVSAALPETGGITFGFTLVPRQGWLFWIKVTAIVGAVLFVILLAFGSGFVTLGFSLPQPRLNSTSEVLPLFLWMCVVAPLFEEVTYRLVLCPPFSALLGTRSCIVLSGLIFAGLHFLYGNPSPENLLGGFILGWAFLKSGTLIIPISLHALGNLCAFLGQVGYFYWWQGNGM
jgi:membrane protease YdiL (CAAX protease family)